MEEDCRDGCGEEREGKETNELVGSSRIAQGDQLGALRPPRGEG